MKIHYMMTAMLVGAAGLAYAQEMTAVDGYKAAMEKMHHSMMIDYTGDADYDFVAGMIPHHQGAVDMCKVELQYGKDPDLRQLCEDIVKTQAREIAMMKEWQEEHRVPATVPAPMPMDYH